MAAPGMPHYVPGMGFKKLPPGAIRTMSGPESVACRTKCGEVELKITLSAKLLAKPLRAALIEPFLKVHNKRAAAPVAWEDIKCIKVDGYTLDVPAVYSDVGDAGTGTGEEGTSPPPPPSASTFLTKEELKVELVTALPQTLLDGVIAVAREHEEITAENYMNPPPPPLTVKLVAIAAQAGADAAADAVDIDDGSSQVSNVDADASRRCANAFEGVSGGATAVSAQKVRQALLSDDHVRSLCFPPTSPHVPSIDNAVRRLVVDVRSPEPTIELAEFTALFTALSAVACAPQAFAKEEEAPAGRKKKTAGGTSDFLQQLLDDDSCTTRRIA